MLAIFFQMCIIIRVVWNTTIEYAVMAELADAHGSGPCEATRGGSNPFDRTKNKKMSNARLFVFFVYTIKGFESLNYSKHL